MISHREMFLRHVAQTSEEPMMVEIDRAEGVFLYGKDGKRYLDLISGIAVSGVGHGAPEVVKAVQTQAARFMHTMVYGEFVLSPQAQLAGKMADLLGPNLDNVYFVNSGSEAVEGALKLAKKFTGRQELLAFHQSYHGSTHGALSVTGAPELKEGYGPFLPGVDFLRFNAAEDLARITERTAAVIVEPIRGEAGIEPAHACYLRALRERCYQTGTLLILDEIQTGLGRSGTLFAHQAYHIQPDILVLAKGIGGGMPIGMFIASKEIMHVLTQDPVLGHITTFGGHPVNCAASLAAINKVLDEQLIDRIPALEEIIRNGLAHPAILELRGRGLMFAAELGSFEQVLATIKLCTERGLITDWFLHCNTAVRIAPPLTISESELRDGIATLLEVIVEVRG